MPTIEAYRFGHLVMDGKTYTKDVIIHPDGSIHSPWWRKSGHRLEAGDIAELIGMRPEFIIAGTGAQGMMVPEKELLLFLKQTGIEFISLPTGEAVRRYNELALVKKTGGCFHLTC